MTSHQDMADQLEIWIDMNSVGEALEMLAGICQKKAEHIHLNWQDRETAKPWDRGGDTEGRMPY